MDTVIVASSQFYSHYPKRIPQGTVNAEAVLVRLDPEWDNLTVRIHWLNVASGVEKVVLLERDQANTIPWEVLTDLGELRMGLVGLDGETVIKPTIWLTYGYVADGVDPESGSDPKPPTPSWEQQMVEQATQANQAAQAAQKASEEAAKSAASAGPYADEAKKSAEAAKASQKAADTSAKQAANAKDQANIASDTAKEHADAAGAAKEAAKRAAETAGNAQSGASQSAQAAANSAQAAERAKQEAQNAAAALPAPSREFAGMVPVVNPEGNGYIFGKAGGGRIDDTTLGRDTTWSSLKIVDSLAPKFESSGPVVTCNPVPGYPLSVVSQISAVQSGTGDPSPDNVRPVKGWDEANLWIVGKNLFNLSGDINHNYLGEPDRNYNLVDEGVLTANANSDGVHLVGQVVNVKKGTPVTFSFDMLDAGTGRCGYVGIYEIGIASIRTGVQPKTPGHYVLREYVPETDTILFVFGTNGGKGAKYKNISLTFKHEGGGYEPYNGSTYIATFEDTVYGGQFNWTTGELIVDWVKYTATGDEKPDLGQENLTVKRWYFTVPTPSLGNAGASSIICDKLKTLSSASQDEVGCICTGNGLISILLAKDTVPDSEAVKEWLKTNQPEFVYKTSKVETIQLSPTEVLALSGVNTLYTNTGDITVSGRADPNSVIKGLEDKIAEMQGDPLQAQSMLFSR